MGWEMSGVTDTRGMFNQATSFNGDISKWEMSSVTDMTYMFRDAIAFKSDISEWDVSSVIDIPQMFMRATSFNGDISKWDVSRVVSMQSMFNRAMSFNADISKWNVARVTNMDNMFSNAESFKQNLCGAAWVNSHKRASQKDIFKLSYGSISRTACTASHRATKRPLPDRELINRPDAGTACTKCGKFQRSGRVSCCA